MTKHDARIDSIRHHLRGTGYVEHPRANFFGFVMQHERGAELALEFMRRNRLLVPLLEWTRADEPFGVLILNRQRCHNCQEKWVDHVTPGGKCLFDAGTYIEGPL